MTDDPTRLCDDPSTPAFVRDALKSSASFALVTPDTASSLARFDAYMAADGAAAAAAATGAGAAAGSTGAGTAAGTSAGTLGVSRAGWWALGGAGSVIVAAVIWFGIREPRRADRRVAPPPAPMHAVTSAGVSMAPTPAAHASPDVVANVAAVASPTAVRAVPDAPTHGAHGLAAAPRGSVVSSHDRAETDGDEVRREFAQLARVRAAVARDLDEALALAAAGNREFPRGMLREERDALAIRALARLGRHGALQRAATAYLRRFPHGIHSAEVRQELTARPR